MCVSSYRSEFCRTSVCKEQFKQRQGVRINVCIYSRAIHLKLIMDMSIEEILRGFKHFIARRGISDIVINDNFKTFRSRHVRWYMLRQGIRQQFLRPASPWWGGFCECLVRTVISCLTKTPGRLTRRLRNFTHFCVTWKLLLTIGFWHTSAKTT